MPSQVSLTDQLEELVAYANHEGLYDAADFLKRLLDTRKPKAAKCPQCGSEALVEAPGSRACSECGLAWKTSA